MADEVDLVETILWGLFTAGGFLAALIIPMLIFITGIGVPTGFLSQDILSYSNILERFGHPLIKLPLIFALSLSIHHGLHRFRALLLELKLKKYTFLVSSIIYSIEALSIVSVIYVIIFL